LIISLGPWWAESETLPAHCKREHIVDSSVESSVLQPDVTCITGARLKYLQIPALEADSGGLVFQAGSGNSETLFGWWWGSSVL
jgi:hypothetical protein